MDEEPEEMDRDMAGLHGVEEQAEGYARGLNSLHNILCSLILAANIWQFLSLRTSIFLIISLVSFQYILSNTIYISKCSLVIHPQITHLAIGQVESVCSGSYLLTLSPIVIRLSQCVPFLLEELCY